MSRYRTLLSALLLNFLLTAALPAFQQTPKPPDTTTEKDARADMKEATGAGAAVDPHRYKIGAEDVLFVRVWREPELSGPVAVRPDGKINLPLIGELSAIDLTPVELEANITKAYSGILKNPIIMLQVQRVESKKYYISGEVMRTGAFPLVSNITILQALTMAGGVREFGNAKKIIIMRGDERIKFNYKEVLAGKKKEQNILLMPGDHIHVP